MQVSPVNFKALAYVLEVEGFDARAALGRCGFASLTALDEQGPWLPVARFDALMDAVLDATGDTCFGLVAGKSKGLMQYVALIQLTLVAPTLRHVLDGIARFAPLYLERSELVLFEQGGAAHLLVEPVVTAGRTGRFRTELVAMSAFQAVGFARGRSDEVHAVEFPYDVSAADAERYVATFGPAVRFGCRRCAVGFDPRLLDVPLPTHNAMAYMGALANAEAALAAQRAGLDVTERVRRWLVSALPQQPSVQQTAEHLRMTERSLRRQLAAMDVTYVELTQQCQQLTAKHLLSNPALPIKQVADRLGFASVTSFHRAFRRWTDMTPLDWRQSGHRATPANATGKPGPAGSIDGSVGP